LASEVEQAAGISSAAAHNKAGVLEGADGFLFLANDSNRLFDQHTGVTRLPSRWMGELAKAQGYRNQALKEIGGRYLHVIVPNKETTLTAMLPKEMQYGVSGMPPVPRYLQRFPEVREFTAFEPEVLRNLGARTAYRPDDTHWTPVGALQYLAYILSTRPEYQSAVQHLLAPMNIEMIRRKGDLGSKLPGTPISIYPILKPKVNAAELLHNNGLMNRARVRVYKNPQAPDQRRILITHDSFGETYYDLLPAIFGTVAFIHTPDFDPALVKELAPDLYLNMQVERFFIRLPSNSMKLSEYIKTVAADRGASADPVETLKALHEGFAR
jgi:hypothetical protein